MISHLTWICKCFFIFLLILKIRARIERTKSFYHIRLPLSKAKQTASVPTTEAVNEVQSYIQFFLPYIYINFLFFAIYLKQLFLVSLNRSFTNCIHSDSFYINGSRIRFVGRCQSRAGSDHGTHSFQNSAVRYPNCTWESVLSVSKFR